MWKIGDKLICINAGPNVKIKTGQIYIITNLLGTMVDLKGLDEPYYKYRFDKIKNHTMNEIEWLDAIKENFKE